MISLSLSNVITRRATWGAWSRVTERMIFLNYGIDGGPTENVGRPSPNRLQLKCGSHSI